MKRILILTICIQMLVTLTVLAATGEPGREIEKIPFTGELYKGPSIAPDISGNSSSDFTAMQPATALEGTKISVTIGQPYILANDTQVALDAPAYINSAGYTMVPLRAIANCLEGATVDWDKAARAATVNYQGETIKMKLDSKNIEKNNGSFLGKTLPEIRQGRTFIPMRDLAEAFGLSDIRWDSKAKTAVFYF